MVLLGFFEPLDWINAQALNIFCYKSAISRAQTVLKPPQKVYYFTWSASGKNRV